MPNFEELIGRLVSLIGEILGASSLRLGFGPTLAVLGVLLVLLHLVARPTSRWTTRDLGNLAAVGRSMALAAEAGSAAVFSLGMAGIARSTAAGRRMQTLAALPILAHVARAVARSGVPLRVSVNDPVAAAVASAVLADAHRATATGERVGRSQVAYLGEGRIVAAAHAMAAQGPSGATFVMGSLGEEGLLLLDGLVADSTASSVGTADAEQASSVLLEGDGTLIGPELFLAPADLHGAAGERTLALATNRVIWVGVAILVIGTALALTGVADVRDFLLGAG